MNCYIIGHPLSKPRSVTLWKNYFKSKNLKIKMGPIDVAPEKLSFLIKSLKKDQSFLASAITMPYKKKILKFAKFGDILTKKAQASNLIIKKNGNLVAYNTDVEGALKTIGKKKYKKIMIYGLGGSGLAIFNVLYGKLKKTKFFLITSKNKKNFNTKRIAVSKKIKSNEFRDIDLFINCSPLGSNLKKKYIKKTPINSKFLEQSKKKLFIFDIVYKPEKTVLHKLCKSLNINYQNGIEMNTTQAEFAISKVLGNYEKPISKS